MRVFFIWTVPYFLYLILLNRLSVCFSLMKKLLLYIWNIWELNWANWHLLKHPISDLTLKAHTNRSTTVINFFYFNNYKPKMLRNFFFKYGDTTLILTTWYLSNCLFEPKDSVKFEIILTKLVIYMFLFTNGFDTVRNNLQQ